jgi:hypothetical protein
VRHDGRCKHSTLRQTTQRYRKHTLKRLPGTKGVTVVLGR